MNRARQTFPYSRASSRTRLMAAYLLCTLACGSPEATIGPSDASADAANLDSSFHSDLDATSGADGLCTAPYEGNWAGTTSQGNAIRFVVVGCYLVEWDYGFTLPMCTPSTTTTTFAVPVPLSGSTFDYTETAGPGGVATMMHIVFASESDAQGTVHFVVRPVPNVGGCGGDVTTTFVAKKS